MYKVLVNKARCKRCGSVIESVSTHNLKRCSCGAISVDGGLEYIRRNGDSEDYEELSVYQLKYQWTEDGVPELGEASELVLQIDTECYHCGNNIPAGKKVLQIKTSDQIYYLHPKCFKKSTYATV